MSYIISSGESSNGIVLSFDIMTVLDGGTVDDITVNPYGSMWVSGGATATGIVENGGYVDVANGANVTFVPNTFSEQNISLTSVTVHSGTTANSTIINGCGSMFIFNGGRAVNTTVNSHGAMSISAGGIALEIIENGGYVDIASGASVSFVSNSFSGLVLQNAATLHSGTTANSTTINSDGYLYTLSGGIANSTTVNNLGRLFVYNGGTANSTTVKLYGSLFIFSGGTANETTVSERGTMTISNGGKANGTIVNSRGYLLISSGGTANDTTISSSGSMYVYSVGKANYTTVNSGGNLYVSSRGTANDTTVNSGGWLYVSSGGGVVDTTVSPGGYIYVHSGGTANRIMENGGVVYVADGANVKFAANTFGGLEISKASATVHSGTIASDVAIRAGGKLLVYSGGSAIDVVWTPFVGVVQTEIGADITFANHLEGVFYGIRDVETLLSSTGLLESITVDRGQEMYVMSSGLVNNTIISSGGSMYIFSGGTANDITISSNGTLRVVSGGTASHIVASPDALLDISVAPKTYVEGTLADVAFEIQNGSAVNCSINSGNVLRISSGGTAIETTVNSGGNLFVSSGGTVDNTTVNSVGRLYIFGGGIANSTMVESSGRMFISSGGTANSTSVFSDGRIFVSGTADNTTVNSCGTLFVSSGGTADNTTVNSKGQLEVSRGGTANNTIVNSSGFFYNLRGGIANETIINFGGNMILSEKENGYYYYSGYSSIAALAKDTLISSGGTLTVNSGGLADNTIVNSGGNLYVSSGGTANIIFNPWQGNIYSNSGAAVAYLDRDAGIYYGGWICGIVSKANDIETLDIESGMSVIVYSGGTANGITATSGGCISFDVASDTYVKGVYNGSAFEMKNAFISGYAVNSGGSLAVSSGGIADHIVVSNGGLLVVLNNGTATNAAVSSGGKIAVSQGGFVNSTNLSAGGILDVFSGGTATDTVVSSGGSLHVSTGGAAKNATIDSNGSMFVSADGMAESTTVNSLGRFFVYSGGVAANTTVNLYGSFFISSGGTANQTLVESGQLFVSNGGYASGVILRAGTDRNQGDLFISSGGTAESVQIEQYGDCYISGGGMVNDVTVNATGYLRVENLGTATAIKENGGYVDVQNGAEVTFAANTFSTVELVNASATVHSGTIAANTKIGSNAYVYIYEGGSATETMVDSGYLIVSNGGVAAKTNVNSGGRFYVSGGTAAEVTAASGAYLEFSVMSDTLITGASGGSAFEIADGTVNDGYTLDSARIDLGAGVTATGMKVNQGGRLYVSAGATANEIVENGGSIDFDAEATIAFAKNTFSGLVYSNASATIHSGTTAANIVASSGGRIRVYSDGIADGVDVYGGGVLYVSSGGTATTIMENGGFVSAAEGAIVSFESADLKKLTLLDSASLHSNTRMTSTTASRGGLTIFNGGIADTTMLLDGRSYIFSGGVANSTTVYSRASLEVNSGGTASGVDIKFRGSANVAAGLLCDLNISSGGTLSLRSGKLSGKVEIEGGAYVSVLNGTILDFDISRIAPDSDALVNNLSLIRGTPQYTLTVGTQKSGSYMLAEGALRFNSTITVFNTEGVQLGTLTTGSALTTDRATYTLVSFGESLSVDVETFAPQAPNASADITSSTTQPVTVAAIFSEDCTFKEYSYDGKEWLAYTEPIKVTENRTIYFRGINATGNVSEVTSYVIDNIILTSTGKPVASADITTPTNQTVTVTAVFDSNSVKNEYSTNGLVWLTYVDGVRMLDNGVVYFRSTYATGAISEIEAYTVDYIDKVAPDKPFIFASNTNLTNQDITVTAVFSEDSAVKEYSTDGLTWLAYTEPITVTENGIFLFRAKDAAGNNSGMVSFEVSNIDKDAPIKPVASADITSPTNLVVTVTATFSEDSTIKEYSLDGENWIIYTTGVAFSQNGTIRFRAKDAVGNVSDVTTYAVTNIQNVSPDTTKPMVSNVMASTQAPTNQNVIVTADFADDVEPAQSLYRIGESGTWTAYPEGGVTVTENATVFFKAVDATGNESEVVSCTVDNIDKVKPVKPTVSADITDATDAEVKVSAVFSDDSIVREFSRDNQTWSAYVGAVAFSENGVAYFRGTDAAGNISEVASYTVSNIDTGTVTSSGFILDSGSATIHENEVYLDTVISSGWLYISSGGTAKNIVVSSQGFLSIYSGGVASVVTVNPHGTMWYVPSGGTATEVVENGGVVLIQNGATVTFVKNTFSGQSLTGIATVHSGTTASNNTVDSGGDMWVSSGGLANNNTVSFGGTIDVSSGGIAINTIIESGGTFKLSSGGKMTGQTEIISGASVSIIKGAIIDFDISAVSPDSEARINNYSALGRTVQNAVFTLTVSDTQTVGTYKLAEGAGSFDKTISVVNTAGESLGFFVVGGTVKVGDADCTLKLTDSVLSVMVAVSGNTSPLDNLVGTPDKVSWNAATAGEDQQFIVEYSTDNFEHVIQVVTSASATDLLDLPSGTYQWRVKAENSEEWAVGETFVSETESDTPKVVQSNEDGNDDLFFASTNGTWENIYYAHHVGSIGDWGGTNDWVSAAGKGRIQNLFFGSSDPNVLCLTDAENGDAIFVDDVYTDSPDDMAKETSRLYKIQEIRAGAGDDIVDMTSQRFEYTGDGLTIHGGEGNDTIWANKGDNWLFGDAGDDRIVGASGNDVIAGGIGNDRMHGGGGNDIFTSCDNWGTDEVEQLETGMVTLWFTNGSLTNWDVNSLTYTDGNNTVKVFGVTLENITLKFGDDKSKQFTTLTSVDAFAEFTSQKIFEESGKGILASL